MSRRLFPLLFFFILACSDGVVMPEGVVEVQFTVLSGDEQIGPYGQELPEPLVVLATRDGKPWRFQVVNFVVTQGGGSVFAGSALTDNKGVARDFWTLGSPGLQELQVRAVSSDTGEKLVFAIFSAEAFGPPSGSVNIECLSSDGNWYRSGSCGWPQQPVSSTAPVTFRVVDDMGLPRVNVYMEFTIDPECLGSCDNPGSVSPGFGFTDAQGEITVDWTLGPNVGSNRLEAWVPSRAGVGVWRGGY